MELKLNIYKGREIEKTYTSNDFMLMTGTCEDILKLIDIDKFSSNLSETELGMEILKIVIKAFDKFNVVMKEIFDGLTDEEYKRTQIKDVAGIVVQVVIYTINELFSISNRKN